MAARGGTSTAPRFTGHQLVATVESLDDFVRAAAPGASFVYCEAPDLIRGETSLRVRELAQQGYVRTHNERRAGGGFKFTVVRTRYKPTQARDPVQVALAEVATATIFRELKRAANLGLPCPSDAELARRAGLASRDQAQWRFRKLVDVGLIASTLAYEGGVPSRVVTIAATGKFTALPKKWAELQRAAERGAVEAREARS